MLTYWDYDDGGVKGRRRKKIRATQGTFASCFYVIINFIIDMNVGINNHFPLCVNYALPLMLFDYIIHDDRGEL